MFLYSLALFACFQYFFFMQLLILIPDAWFVALMSFRVSSLIAQSSHCSSSHSLMFSNFLIKYESGFSLSVFSSTLETSSVKKKILEIYVHYYPKLLVLFMFIPSVFEMNKSYFPDIGTFIPNLFISSFII